MHKSAKTVIFVFFSLLMSAVLVYTGIIAADTNLRRETKVKLAMNKTTEGEVYTTDGKCILSVEGDNQIGTVADTYIYSPLLGYCRKNTDYPAQYSSDLSLYVPETQKNTVRNALTDYLLIDNDDDFKGETVTLTIDSSLQEYAWRLLKNSGKTAYYNTACVVMDNSTGAIRAMVSIKSAGNLDYNNLSAIYNSIDVDNYPGMFTNECLLAKTTGSIFKVVSACPIIEAGLNATSFAAPSSVRVFNTDIQNNGGKDYGEVDLAGGLKYSANTYFINVYLNKLSGEVLQNAAKSFLIGEKYQTDIFNLTSSVNLDTEDKMSVAMACFGQGTTLTPIQACSIISTVENGGRMLRPYLIESVTNTADGKKAYTATAGDVMTTAISASTAQQLKTALASPASYYGFSDGIIAKSGTGEVEDGSVAWMIAANEKYSVCIRTDNSNIYGSELATLAAEILGHSA